MMDNLSQDYYSYGYNDDDTEPTPVPHTYRPPLPSQHPESQSPNDLSLLDKSLFSFSVGGTLPEEGSLPSFPQEPPSPLSRPTSSLLEGEVDPARLYTRRTTTEHDYNRQPPISEVHLDNSDDDTFFECVDDKSLAQRTRRSLMATPQPKNISTISYDSNRSRSKSRTTTPSLVEMVESSVSQSSRISHSMQSAGTRSRSSSPLKQQQLNLNTTNRTTDPSSDDVVRVHESALQAIIRLKEELLRANDRNEMLKGQQQTLMEEKDEVLSRFHQVHMDLEEKQHQLHSLELDRSDWQQDKRELERQLRSTVRERKDAMHRKLAADNRQKEWKGQLETLQLELEEALALKEELASDLAVLQSTNSQLQREKKDLADQLDSKVQADSGKIKSLRLEMETKDDEIAQLKNTLADTKNEGQELRLKLETLQQEHEKTIKDMESLQQLSLRKQKSSSIRFQEQQHQHEEQEGGVLDSSIADRLAKMRDSAERAHMIRVHKRELSRLKLDKEAEIQRLVSSHEDAMRKAAKQANANLNTKLDELKAVLRDEYEEKMEEVESHHIQKFSKVRRRRSLYLLNQSIVESSILKTNMLFLVHFFVLLDATRILAESRRC